MPAKKQQSSFIDAALSPKGIGIMLVILILLSVGAYMYTRRTTVVSTLSRVPTPTIKPTPTPRSIPRGKIGFSVGGSIPNAPAFGRGYLNPYDPAKGATQVISIEVNDTTAVTSVTGIMKTDNGQQPLTFSLVEGTAQKGNWQATWIVQDTYLYTYELDMVAKNAITSDHVEIMLR
jgi:hypothetical protein